MEEPIFLPLGEAPLGPITQNEHHAAESGQSDCDFRDGMKKILKQRTVS